MTISRLGNQRIWLAAVLSVLILQTEPAGAQTSDDKLGELVFGARIDAEPFSFQNRENGQFDGFIVEICRRMAYRLDRRARFVNVTATTRFIELENKSVHALCEPTTLTVERARKNDFSQIIFISGISYLVHPLRASDIISSGSHYVRAAEKNRIEREQLDSQLAEPSSAASSEPGAKPHRCAPETETGGEATPKPNGSATADTATADDRKTSDKPDTDVKADDSNFDITSAADGLKPMDAEKLAENLDILSGRRLVGFLKGTTAGATVENMRVGNVFGKERACVQPVAYDSHEDGIEAVCSGEIEY